MAKKKAQPSDHDFSQLTVDETLDRLIELRIAKERLHADDAALLDRLDELAAAGEIDHGGFLHKAWSFSWSEGKTSYSYPEQITELEERLNAAKNAAKAEGTAIKSKGKAFWTIAKPKQ